MREAFRHTKHDLPASYDIVLLPGGGPCELDEFTTAELQAEGETSVLDLVDGSSLVFGALLSWQRFNLRLGASFGNYNIPGVNFVIAGRLIVPEIDMYWRF